MRANIPNKTPQQRAKLRSKKNVRRHGDHTGPKRKS